MCHQKICPLYTKTFGGKIGENLHSVSPDNFVDKNFKGPPPSIFPAKTNSTYTILHTNERKNLIPNLRTSFCPKKLRF